jgi:Ca-activated chloride channel family protein
MISNMLTHLLSSGASSGDHFRLAAPWALLLLAVVFVAVSMAFFLRWRMASVMRHSHIPLVTGARPASPVLWFSLPWVLRALALAMFVVALARPQYGRTERKSFAEGIDIMLLLDVSGSMSSQDFVPNRLEAAKEVMKEFVAGRNGDRIGIVVFGATAATIVPLTLDYAVVQQLIDRINFGIVDERQTAIGMGIVTALKKLEKSKARSKVIVLLTDGENNAGNVDPLAAADAAKALKVRIYTIGVGTDTSRSGGLFGGMFSPEAGLDEKTLKAIADKTGGLYFHATSNDKLRAIYRQIDKLEKTRVESVEFDRFNELAPFFIGLAFIFLGMELLVTSTRGVKVP